jgi:hypothetical protein
VLVNCINAHVPLNVDRQNGCACWRCRLRRLDRRRLVAGLAHVPNFTERVGVGAVIGGGGGICDNLMSKASARN